VSRHPSSADRIEFDPGDEAAGREGGLEHLSRRGITADEIKQVFDNGPWWSKNKKGRRANWRMVGLTDGGRPLDIKVLWDEDRGALIPITGMKASDADRRECLRRGGRR
jgi:hypothetical protein